MTCDQLRAQALRRGASSLAASILADREPLEEDLGLLSLCIADATLAGDRSLLRVVPAITRQLTEWLIPEQAWTAEWRGTLRALELISEFALLQLEQERQAG